jgi:transcriptional regulator with XRE-family HTH domain
MCIMSLEVEKEVSSTHEHAQFPEVLQRLRLDGHWKQERLADQLGIRLRTYISWEKGERVPPLAMVMLLSWVVEKKTLAAQFSQSQLLKAYIIDELNRQIRKSQGNQARTKEALLYMMQESIETAGLVVQGEPTSTLPLDQLTQYQLQAPMPEHSTQQEAGGITMNELLRIFPLLQLLGQHLNLIPTTEDFLIQMTKEGE